MAGNVKLMTSAGGGVVLDTATTTATDVTVKVPVTGVNNGTLVCSDSSGNVGIGTSSPSSNAGYGGLTLNGTSGSLFDLRVNNSNTFRFGSIATENLLQGLSNVPMTFYTNNTERMRINSNGELFVNRTTDLAYSPKLQTSGSDGVTALGVNAASTGSNLVNWYYNASLIAAVSTNGSNVTYGTSSDYRLKDNIEPMTGGLDKVMQLKPSAWTWKRDGSDGQGFIAHELQAVVPDCVVGEKDAVDEEGKPVYQGIDTSFLVATLTKAIQEQQAQIEALAAKVAALEAK